MFTPITLGLVPHPPLPGVVRHPPVGILGMPKAVEALGAKKVSGVSGMVISEAKPQTVTVMTQGLSGSPEMHGAVTTVGIAVGFPCLLPELSVTHPTMYSAV